MSKIYWNYFLALESDVCNLSKYIELDEKNFGAFSIELSKVLMAATQEVDVLMKEICGLTEGKIKDYEEYIRNNYEGMLGQEVKIDRYNLSFKPFDFWNIPQNKRDKKKWWWTSNNKIKHHRNNDNFAEASLKNALEALSALFLVNLLYYRYHKKEGLEPSPVLLSTDTDGTTKTWFRCNYTALKTPKPQPK